MTQPLHATVQHRRNESTQQRVAVKSLLNPYNYPKFYEKDYTRIQAIGVSQNRDGSRNKYTIGSRGRSPTVDAKDKGSVAVKPLLGKHDEMAVTSIANEPLKTIKIEGDDATLRMKQGIEDGQPTADRLRLAADQPKGGNTLSAHDTVRRHDEKVQMRSILSHGKRGKRSSGPQSVSYSYEGKSRGSSNKPADDPQALSSYHERISQQEWTSE